MMRRLPLWLLAFTAAAFGLRADAHPFKVDYPSQLCMPEAGAVAYGSDGVRAAGGVRVYCPLPLTTVSTDTSGTPTIIYRASYAGTLSSFSLIGYWQGGTPAIYQGSVQSCPGSFDPSTLTINSSGCAGVNFPTFDAGQGSFSMVVSAKLETFNNGPSFLGPIQVRISP
jgi:hypothetical protein